MKTEVFYLPNHTCKINFLIGKDARDNFAVIDEGSKNDLWFHAKLHSSCHVVCLLPDEFELTEEERKIIIRKGCELCKENTNKISQIKNVVFVYTEIKNISKTKTPGLVNMIQYKTIHL
jgi:predicted ribosome quality control (RQC) complex YloA/Tae2 family protein